MRNLIIICALLLVCSPAHAGLFGQEEQRKPDAGYELDTWGTNSEVYEFTPKTAPHMTCAVYILDNLKSTAMQCFPKKGTKRNRRQP